MPPACPSPLLTSFPPPPHPLQLWELVGTGAIVPDAKASKYLLEKRGYAVFNMVEAVTGIINSFAGSLDDSVLGIVDEAKPVLKQLVADEKGVLQVYTAGDQTMMMNNTQAVIDDVKADTVQRELALLTKDVIACLPSWVWDRDNEEIMRDALMWNSPPIEGYSQRAQAPHVDFPMKTRGLRAVIVPLDDLTILLWPYSHDMVNSLAELTILEEARVASMDSEEEEDAEGIDRSVAFSLPLSQCGQAMLPLKVVLKRGEALVFDAHLVHSGDKAFEPWKPSPRVHAYIGTKMVKGCTTDDPEDDKLRNNKRGTTFPAHNLNGWGTQECAMYFKDMSFFVNW